MYYSNQDYMQDLNFYNQVNPNMQNIGNPNGYSLECNLTLIVCVANFKMDLFQITCNVT